MAFEPEAYESSFGAVTFSVSQAQSWPRKTQSADETIVGGAVSGTSYTYRDWYANPPDTLELDILVADVDTFDSLAALRGYPVNNGGEPYELITPELDWLATLDELTAQGPFWPDQPIKARATFTKVEDVVTPATTPGSVPVADFVWGAAGLTAALDLNQGTTSSDGYIDSYDVEWGDAATTTVSGPSSPWQTGGSSIPTTSHTYAAPGDYIVTVSVVRSSLRSDDMSKVVTVA